MSNKRSEMKVPAGFVPVGLRRKLQTMLLLRYNTQGCLVTNLGNEFKSFYNEDLDPTTFGFPTWLMMLKSMPSDVTINNTKSSGGSVVRSLPLDHNIAIEYANKLHPSSVQHYQDSLTASKADMTNFVNELLGDNDDSSSRVMENTQNSVNHAEMLPHIVEHELVDTVSSTSAPDSPTTKISVGVGTENDTSEQIVEETFNLRVVSIESLAETSEETDTSTVQLETKPVIEPFDVFSIAIANNGIEMMPIDEIEIGPIKLEVREEYPKRMVADQPKAPVLDNETPIHLWEIIRIKEELDSPPPESPTNNNSNTPIPDKMVYTEPSFQPVVRLQRLSVGIKRAKTKKARFDDNLNHDDAELANQSMTSPPRMELENSEEETNLDEGSFQSDVRPRHKRKRSSSRTAPVKDYTEETPKKGRRGKNNGKRPEKRVAPKVPKKPSTRALSRDSDSDSDNPVTRIERDHLLAMSLDFDESSLADEDYDSQLILFDARHNSQSFTSTQETVSELVAEPIAGTSTSVKSPTTTNPNFQTPVKAPMNDDPESRSPLSQLDNLIVSPSQSQSEKTADESTTNSVPSTSPSFKWFSNGNKENYSLVCDLQFFSHEISADGTNYLDQYSSGLFGCDVKELERIRHNQDPTILCFHPFFSLMPKNVVVNEDCPVSQTIISSMNFDSIQMSNIDAIMNCELSNHQAGKNKKLIVVSSYANYANYFHWKRTEATTIVFLDSEQDRNIHIQHMPADIDLCLFEGTGGPVSIFDPETTDQFRTFVHGLNDGDTNGVDVFLANGIGFENMKCRAQDLIISQLLLACELLRPGGIFVIKLQDTFTCLGVGLLFIMSHIFDNISIIKPESGVFGERFVICRWKHNEDDLADRMTIFLRECNEFRIEQSLLIPKVVEVHRLFIIGHIIDYLKEHDVEFLEYIKETNKAIGDEEVKEFTAMVEMYRKPEKDKKQFLDENIKKRNNMLISWNVGENNIAAINDA